MNTFVSKIHFYFLGTLAFFLINCLSAPSAAPVEEQDILSAFEEAIIRMEELQRHIDEGNIFVGNDPAKTPTIGIIRPSNPPTGLLSLDEVWYLDMIRSAMSSNFTRFASGRIRIVNLSDEVAHARNEEITRSLISGSNDELSLTMRAAARSIMTGEIIKQSANRFFLSFIITDTETGHQLAAYNHAHSDIELIEGIAVNRATNDLLRQLNVVLNEAGRQALFGTSNVADIALARGLEAADAGQGLQAMNYLFNAASFTNTASQANMTLAAVQTRNQSELEGAGALVMDFFMRHELWQSRLDEYNNFYFSNAPFELFYTPPTPSNMRVSGSERTYDLHFLIGLRWNQNQISVMERVLQEYILEGLYANPPRDIQAWDLRGLPDDSNLFEGPDNFVFNLLIHVENERGYVITSGTLRLYGSLFRHQGRIYARCTQEATMSFPQLAYIEDQITPHLFIRVVSINGENINTVGETGFIRVVQTQDNRLPPIQPDSLPRALVNQMQRELIASEQQAARLEQERQQRQRDEERRQEREKRQEQRQSQRENHELRNFRYSIAAYGGPMLETDAGTYNIDLGFGGGRFDLELGFTGYVGTEKDIIHSSIATDPFVWGLRFGFGYVYVDRTWLFRISPGISIFGIERSSPSISINSDGTETKRYNNLHAAGSIQTMFDWNPFKPGFGGLFLRLGYRLDIYPGNVSIVFGENKDGIFFTNNVYAGLVYYIGQ